MRTPFPTLIAVLLAACTPPPPAPPPAAHPPATHTTVAAAPAVSPSASSPVATSAASSTPSEHDGFISQHWIGGDPDFACSRHAQCYLAPLQKPEAPAAPPFTMCPQRKLGMPLEPEYTRRLRKEQGFAACCYLARICKLPLSHD